MGISFAAHGAVRIPKLHDVAQGISDQFAETVLSGMPSLTMGYVIPIAEVVCGMFILVGNRVMRYGLAGGILLMGVLMFGTCILEKWEWLPSQLLHALAFYLLLQNKHTPSEKNWMKNDGTKNEV
ncbi:hypothetical protein [Gangjinia marincola]|uniref:hypothetical protein n=1 Tax=Gangjinia marincola TaxID=578463 RepID=UPI0031D80E53